MAIYYVGIGGNDANNGTTWALRKATLWSAENTLVAAGDTVYVGPGVYREQLEPVISGNGGNPIIYIGDVTGENTDGVGGVVRITGSNDDQSATRFRGIFVSSKDYRTFRGFLIDFAVQSSVEIVNSDYIIVEDCVLMYSETQVRIEGTSHDAIIRRCYLAYGNGGFWAFHATGVDGIHTIENCIINDNLYRGIFIQLVDNVTCRNLLLSGNQLAIDAVLDNPYTGTINNSLIVANSVRGIRRLSTGTFTEDYNTFFRNGVDRDGVAVGGNSVTYPPLFISPIIYSGESQASGFKFPWWYGELSEWSQIRAITGTNEPSVDMLGIARPATASKNSWGPMQFQDAERDTGTVYAGSASLILEDAGRVQLKVPCTDRDTMIRVRVQREANYAGVNPQLIIKQPGQADDITADGGAASAWNLLETTITPALDPEYFIVELVSNNTAVAGNYAAFFDNLEIRGEPQDVGEFEHWMWDRQPLDILHSDALVVRGLEYRRRRVPSYVSEMVEQ